MSEPRRRHYENRVEPGQLGFFTFTCLDFAHLFKRPELRDEMEISMLEDMVKHGVRLHAFVVMTHHVHLVARMPEGMTGSRFVQIVKRNSAKRILPLLSSQERAQLRDQTGLNGRSFWKR